MVRATGPGSICEIVSSSYEKETTLWNLNSVPAKQEQDNSNTS